MGDLMLNPFVFVAHDIALMIIAGCVVLAAVLTFRRGDP